MGESAAAVAGGIVGALVGGGAGYQAGYNKRDAELQPIIQSLQNQIGAKDVQLLQQAEQLRQKNQRIAELEKQLNSRPQIPVISQIKKKLGGSLS